MKVELSIVVPVYNDQECVPELLHTLTSVCDSTGRAYEIVLVNDGSTDNTAELLAKAAETNKDLKVITLSRNFGHQSAVSAGFDFAQGSMIVVIDDDLQYPASMIPVFIEYAEKGYDLVIGERLKNKQYSWLRDFLGRAAYKILSLITALDFKNSCDFGLYKRSVIDTLKIMPERDRFLRGMVQWVGFKKIYVPYTAEERKFGHSRYNFTKLAGFMISGVTSFSASPLRLAGALGSLIFLFSLAFSGFVVYAHYTSLHIIPVGWASTVIIILFMSSFQLLILGIFGEYLFRMFNEIKGRPNYIVARVENIEHINNKPSPYGFNSSHNIHG
ncbi:glycosyltransferase family 2 protein [Candidatus Parcubacteria bacterium]|nr:glycosyltransferase family 2 protein [Candidatus Parcubacteria bacterium]